MATKQNYVNNQSAVLSAAATSSATTLTVTSTTGLPSTGQFTVACAGEIMLAAVASSTTLTVTRAQEGTTAQALTAGLYVIPVLTDQSLRNLVRQSISGTNISARRELNFIPAGNLSVAAVDDPTNDACDITLTGGVEATLTAPSLSSFAWLNQGTAVASQSGSNIWLYAIPSPANSNNVRALVEATPGTTPWSIAANLVACFTMGQYNFAGLVLYESSSGKMVYFGPSYNGAASGSIQIAQFASTTSNLGTSYFDQGFYHQPRWFKIQDDGTNHNYFVSPDGVNWVNVYSQTRATGFTTLPDHIGILAFNNAGSGAPGCGLLLTSWSQGT